MEQYRIWPDGTTQEIGEETPSWVSDDFMVVDLPDGITEEQLALAGELVRRGWRPPSRTMPEVAADGGAAAKWLHRLMQAVELELDARPAMDPTSVTTGEYEKWRLALMALETAMRDIKAGRPACAAPTAVTATSTKETPDD